MQDQGAGVEDVMRDALADKVVSLSVMDSDAPIDLNADGRLIAHLMLAQENMRLVHERNYCIKRAIQTVRETEFNGARRDDKAIEDILACLRRVADIEDMLHPTELREPDGLQLVFSKDGTCAVE